MVRHDGDGRALLLVDSKKGEIHPVTAMDSHRAGDAGSDFHQAEAAVLRLSCLKEPGPSHGQHAADARGHGMDAGIGHTPAVHCDSVSRPDAKSGRTVPQTVLSI